MGFVLILIGYALAPFGEALFTSRGPVEPWLEVLGGLAYLFMAPLILVGNYLIVRKKRRHWIWVLVGAPLLFGLIVMIVLYLLPDGPSPEEVAKERDATMRNWWHTFN